MDVYKAQPLRGKQLLSEACVLRRLEHHDNIQAFVGQCSQRSSQFVLFELCSNGNLRDLLRGVSVRMAIAGR